MQLQELKKLKKSFFGVFALNIFGVPLTLLASVILARTLSIADFGVFGFVISLATVLSIPTASGMPMLLTREVAGYVSTKDWSSYRGIIGSAYTWVASFSLMVGVGIVIWGMVSGNSLESRYLITILLVPLFGLTAIRGGILRGLAHPVLAEAPVRIIQPILLIAGYLLLAQMEMATTLSVLWWYLAVSIIIFIIASIAFFRVQPVKLSTITASRADMPKWLRSLLPFSAMSAATVLSTQIVVLILGAMGEKEAVAQMRVAEQGAQLVAFPLLFINTVVGPYFVRALKGDKSNELAHVSRLSARLTFAVTLPIALILIFFGKYLITLTFGASYAESAYFPMVILIGGQLISVSLGNSGILLAMTGKEKITLYSQLLSLILVLVSSVVLIDFFGIIGGALSSALGLVAAKCFSFFAVKRIFKFYPGLFC